MGAFLLVSESTSGFEESRAIDILKRQCRTEPISFNLGKWRLHLFPKFISGKDNYIDTPSHGIYTTGSPFVSGFGFSETLQKLFDDFKNNILDIETISGNFFLLLRSVNGLMFTTERSGIYSIYHSSDGSVISSSFLSICEGMENLTLSKETITENLLTGSVVGSDTIFNEIKRFEPKIPFQFRNLEFIPPVDRYTDLVRHRTKKESQYAQIEYLDSYFSGLKVVAEENGVDCGITGGMDSRLLFALCRRHFSHGKIQFHSHLRKQKDRDYIYGREICMQTRMEFVNTAVMDISDAGEKEIIKFMESGMMFNDGQVRTHAFWHEEFNSADYRIKTLKNKGMGLNGIGGEQYRNMERVITPSWNFRNWILNDLVKKYAGSGSVGRTIYDQAASIGEKIRIRLDGNYDSRIDLLGIKRYMNEIYNPANRGLRIGYENRISYYLSPFADSYISTRAYEAIEHLGVTINYEADLINLIDPEIAKINSVYGFSFNKHEPVSSLIPQVIYMNFIPGSMRTLLAEKILGRSTTKWHNISSGSSHLTMCIDTLSSINLPLSIYDLLSRVDTGPLIYSMGHLILRYSRKISS